MTDRRHLILWGLFGLQAFCAVFFASDTVLGLMGLDAPQVGPDSDTIEYLVSAALVLGLVFTGAKLRHMTLRNRRLTQQLQVASSAFADLLQRQFEEWSLTQAERDIAILSIKGFSQAKMAALRQTKEDAIRPNAPPFIARRASPAAFNYLASLSRIS
jgi:hypothetical protein